MQHTKWGKQKETILATYNAISQFINFATPVGLPTTAPLNLTEPLCGQNSTLRIANVWQIMSAYDHMDAVLPDEPHS